MEKTAKKDDWVRIEQMILSPEQRMETLPETTRQHPLKCWINGFLQNDEARIGETVTILTNADRFVEGMLYEIWPNYTHTFGRQQTTLINVRNELADLMGGNRNE